MFFDVARFASPRILTRQLVCMCVWEPPHCFYAFCLKFFSLFYTVHINDITCIWNTRRQYVCAFSKSEFLNRISKHSMFYKLVGIVRDWGMPCIWKYISKEASLYDIPIQIFILRTLISDRQSWTRVNNSGTGFVCRAWRQWATVKEIKGHRRRGRA